MTSTEDRTMRVSWEVVVALTLCSALVIFALALFGRPARADGMYPPPPPPVGRGPSFGVPLGRGSPSCLLTAGQLAYLTGRRELGYAATEACMAFTGTRQAVLPYGYYGPYVPPDYFTPPGWVVPVPQW